MKCFQVDYISLWTIVDHIINTFWMSTPVLAWYIKSTVPTMRRTFVAWLTRTRLRDIVKKNSHSIAANLFWYFWNEMSRNRVDHGFILWRIEMYVKWLAWKASKPIVDSRRINTVDFKILDNGKTCVCWAPLDCYVMSLRAIRMVHLCVSRACGTWEEKRVMSTSFGNAFMTWLDIRVIENSHFRMKILQRENIDSVVINYCDL